MVPTLLFPRLLKVFVAFITGTAMLLGPIGAPRRASALSISEEKDLGRDLMRLIQQKLKLVEDGDVLTYVHSVGSKIVKTLGTTSYEYRFFVVDQSVPNAFAIPGGYIFVNRGLIEIMQSEGELASILSHEIGHIEARHIHRRMMEGRALSIASIAGMIAGILLGMKSDAGPALAMGAAAGAQTFALQYSRENEAEADQLGLGYLCAAGYQPEDMVNMMRRLNEKTMILRSNTPTYLSTHPPLSERQLRLGDLGSRKSRDKKKPAGDTDFPFMQAALVAEYADLDVAQERFEAGARRKDPVCLYGLARLMIRQSRTDEALGLLIEAARLKPGSAFVLSTLGSAYQQAGKAREAQRVLQSALLLDPGATIVQFRLALVLQELGQREEALRKLQEIEPLSSIFPDIDYQLGVICGQVNRIGDAHYYLGQYYEGRQDWRLAFFHYKKARALCTDSVQRITELDRVLKDLEKKKKEDSVASKGR